MSMEESGQGSSTPGIALNVKGIVSGTLSQPSSPRLSRLGRVTRLISRSDASLLQNSKGKRVRNDSGDSGPRISQTPEEGSPSKSSSLIAKASGYMTHLKSRIGKHRDKSREKDTTQQTIQQTFHCCGNKKQDESFDTISGPPESGRNSVPSIMADSTSGAAEGSASISVSVNVSSNSEFDAVSADGDENRPPSVIDNTRLGMNNIMKTATYPFYTLSVHLQRGKNLVARDACGSSDPYVKVKIGEKLHYKSKTIYRDLNPYWDESFILPISDLSTRIIFKVFDYDWGFQDDFMGMTSLDVSSFPPNKSQDVCLTLTENNTPGEKSMGEIFLLATLVPRTIEEREIWFSDTQGGSGRLVDSQRRLKGQIWTSVLTILLIEAKNLSQCEEERLLMDLYVKFRLGNQKYKTRTIPKISVPKWLEQFDFYIYEGQPQILEIQIFDESFSRDHIGRCCIDIGLLAKEETHTETLQLQDGPGEITMLLTISGTCGAETISDLTSYNPSDEETQKLKTRFSLAKSLHSIKEVGYLTVKVYEAQGLASLDIGGKSDPFCVLELVNARLQTQTEYRTLNPSWNKIFTFAVKDITSVLEVTVYDEDKNHKQEFLGKLNFPLLKIRNGEKKWWVLKDQKLTHPAKGTNPQILLEMDLVWNPVRAGIRVMDPPEQKFIQPDLRLKREVFLLNIDRLRKIGMVAFDMMQYIQSCVEWEYPLRSIIALVIYELLVYSFQPFMIPFLLMILILRQWVISSITGASLDECPDDDTFVLDEDDEEDQEKKMSLRQKLQAVQDATQTLQNALGSVASICESTRNTFKMTVPFISWLAILGLFVGTILLYFIPLRYLAMGYGLHKFLRPLLRPHVTPTNEVYNLIMRVPDSQELQLYKPLRPSSSDSQRNRSPPGKAPPTKKKYKFW